MDLRTSCIKCNKKMNYGEMRAIPGQGYMCIDCFKNPEGKMFSEKTEKIETPQSIKVNIEKPKTDSEQINYVCEKCKYKFSRKASLKIDKCPYCGGKNFHERSLDSTDRLVKEY